MSASTCNPQPLFEAAFWLTSAAHYLRDEGLINPSPARIIDAVCLVNALSDLRKNASPNLEDLLDAAEFTLCDGETALSDHLRTHFNPAQSPLLPELAPGEQTLPADLARLLKTRRLPLSETLRAHTCDLRKPREAARSQLIRQLLLIKLNCAQRQDTGRERGTFRETWSLAWTPDCADRLAHLARRFPTLAAAVDFEFRRQAARAASLPDLAALVELGVAAGLGRDLPPLLARLEYSAGLAADFPPLALSLTALSRAARYPGPRLPHIEAIRQTAAALAPRACLTLPPAARGNDQAAREILPLLEPIRPALHLLDLEELTPRWERALTELAESPGSHPLLAGATVRQLSLSGTWSPSRVALALEYELSPGHPPDRAAAWLEGFLTGSRNLGPALAHRAELWPILDRWLRALSPEAFLHALPLLRRAFAACPAHERAALRQFLVNQQTPPPSPPPSTTPQPLSMTSRLLVARPGKGGAP
jgi:hypothetical protein